MGGGGRFQGGGCHHPYYFEWPLGGFVMPSSYTYGAKRYKTRVPLATKEACTVLCIQGNDSMTPRTCRCWKTEGAEEGALAPTDQRQQQVMLYQPYSRTVFGNFHGFIVASQQLQLGQIPISLVVVSSE